MEGAAGGLHKRSAEDRVPLVARQRQSLSAGLVSLLCAERMEMLFALRENKARLR